MDVEQTNSKSLTLKIVLVAAGLFVVWIALGLFRPKTDNAEIFTNQEYEQTVDATSVAYRNISPNELETLLVSAEADSITLIDTHIPEQAHIPETDAFVPFNEITSRLDELPQDKSTPIVLYCRSGNMSETASRELADLGYSNVYNLEGGTNAWKASGREVVSEKL